MKGECYFCEKEAVSKEHVPPKCLFPAQKDTCGQDFRKNLIKVPSCDEHNAEKSGDDEYLMMILVSYFENNDTAKNQIKTKLARVFLKNPKKMDYFKNSTVMQTLNETLLKVDLDTDRFIQSLELIAHAIHLHRYKVKVKNPYKFISAPIFEDEKEDLEAIEVNDARKSIMNLTNEAFEAIPKAGENQDILWYQLSPEFEGKYLLRLCFYGAFPVILYSTQA